MSLNDDIVDAACLRDDIRSFSLGPAGVAGIGVAGSGVAGTSTQEQTPFSMILARVFLTEFFLGP